MNRICASFLSVLLLLGLSSCSASSEPTSICDFCTTEFPASYQIHVADEVLCPSCFTNMQQRREITVCSLCNSIIYSPDYVSSGYYMLNFDLCSMCSESVPVCEICYQSLPVCEYCDYHFFKDLLNQTDTGANICPYCIRGMLDEGDIQFLYNAFVKLWPGEGNSYRQQQNEEFERWFNQQFSS